MLLQDLKYAIRQLVMGPGFVGTAVMSLALGIGAAVTVFSVIYGVLLHPFPYANVDRLANLSVRDRRGEIFDEWFPGPELAQVRAPVAFSFIGMTRNPASVLLRLTVTHLRKNRHPASADV